MAELRDPPEFWLPKAWPLFWRRTFFVTLPISGPIWFAAVAIGMFVVMVLAITLGIPTALFFYLKEELWDEPPPAPERGGAK